MGKMQKGCIQKINTFFIFMKRDRNRFKYSLN